jgi:hypothetical protein
MRNAVDCGRDREELHREDGWFGACPETDSGPDPDCEPAEVEDQEEVGRPRREAEYRRKPSVETGRVLPGDVQDLDEHSDAKEQRRAAPFLNSSSRERPNPGEKDSGACHQRQTGGSDHLAADAVV